MRSEGSLSEWNEERGFGFIAPREGGPEIFVHRSAFPKGGPKPMVGERIWYELGSDRRGRRRAVNLSRPGDAAPQSVHGLGHRTGEPVGGGLGSVVALLLAAAAIYVAFGAFRQQAGPSLAVSLLPAASDASPATGEFNCDGRTRCAQMRSCEEARFFLHNCPGMSADGEAAGESCEQQWCAQSPAR